jgi:hypothetical protein
MAMQCGLPRPTVDIDHIEVVPVQETARLQPLAERVGVVSVPENYLDPSRRCIRRRIAHCGGLGHEGHDLALSE